jgi:hypothetical protein
MPPTTSAKVKKQVFDEFKKANVTLSKDGRAAVNQIWGKTLGHFFKRYRAAAETKWRQAKVKSYSMRAVRAIVKESGRLSKGNPVTKADMNKAALKVIKKFRKVCPPGVGAGQMNGPVRVKGALCEIYP